MFNGKIHYFYGHFQLLCNKLPEGNSQRNPGHQVHMNPPFLLLWGIGQIPSRCCHRQIGPPQRRRSHMGVGIVGIVIWDQEVYGSQGAPRINQMMEEYAGYAMYMVLATPLKSTRRWLRHRLLKRFEDPGPAKQQTSTNAAQIENCHDVGLKNAMLWKAHVPMCRKCLKSVWKVQPENHSWCRIKSVPTHPNADVFVLVVRKNLLGLSAKRKKEGQRLWQ